MKTVIDKIKANGKIKKIIHWMLIPTGEARPRLWVRYLVNPFVHKRGKGSKIRSRTRIDVFPFNTFSLGRNSIIEDFSTVNNGVGPVIIGDHTLIGMSNVIIGPVTLGNNIIIAQNVVISGLNHIYTDIDKPISEQAVTTSEIIIEDDCWIAANAVITAGVHIGKHSVVAAGSVVTKTFPAYSIIAGNPAVMIKKFDFDTRQWVSAHKM